MTLEEFNKNPEEIIESAIVRKGILYIFNKTKYLYLDKKTRIKQRMSYLFRNKLYMIYVLQRKSYGIWEEYAYFNTLIDKKVNSPADLILKLLIEEHQQAEVSKRRTKELF